MTTAANLALVRRFLGACVRADPDEFAGYFAEDAVWWNAPWQRVQGRDAIREALRRGAEQMRALPWELLHIAAAGAVVLTERVDHFAIGDTRIRVPCMGIFEIRAGKIAAWRDYWDLKQFESQVPPSSTTAP
jgi:limonene-1,2-epoxide hydrolase